MADRVHKDRVWVVVSNERVKPIDLHFLQVVYDSRCDRWWYICRSLNMFIHSRDSFPIRPTTQKGRQAQHPVLKPMAAHFAGNRGELRAHLTLRCCAWLQPPVSPSSTSISLPSLALASSAIFKYQLVLLLSTTRL